MTVEKKFNAEQLLQYNSISYQLLNSLLQYEDTPFFLSEDVQKQLITLFQNTEETELWELLLEHVDCSSLSDDVISYLINNKIALVSLCHLPLKDKWLKKLIYYDEDALMQLSERYYLSNLYSDSFFAEFYYHYLSKSQRCIQLLLDFYEDSSKRTLLLYLCKSDPNYQQFINSYLIADTMTKCTDPDKIRATYNQYNQNAIIVTKIAKNYFTPNDILLSLFQTQNCPFASSIRKASKKTFETKTKINKSKSHNHNQNGSMMDKQKTVPDNQGTVP